MDLMTYITGQHIAEVMADRPERMAIYASGGLSHYETDPYGGDISPRDPIDDTVEVQSFPDVRVRVADAGSSGASWPRRTSSGSRER